MAHITRKGNTITARITGEELLTATYPLQPEITFGQLVCELARQKLNLQGANIIKVEFTKGEFLVTFNPPDLVPGEKGI
jgi:hypothetical protein